jgi:hypothetical protein
MITNLQWLPKATEVVNEKVVPLLKSFWEWSTNYESDEDFIIRMKKEYPDDFEKVNLW